MNECQNKALEMMNSGKNVFITGSAGVGKSFLIQHFIKSSEKKISVTSTTGVSAILIGGRTIHSWAGIGISNKDYRKTLFSIRKNKPALDRWLNTEVLIIDEISMIDHEVLSLLNSLAADLRSDHFNLFGGIQLIVAGDWAQLSPINKSTFAFEHSCWKSLEFNTVILHKIMRQEDEIFINMLQELRLGECSKETEKIINNTKENLKDSLILPTKLRSRNTDVDKINETEFAKLSKDNAVFSYKAIYNSKYAQDKFKDITPDLLNLCVGCQVMVTYNISQESGVVNGTRGIVEYCDPLVIKIKLMDGFIYDVPKVIWDIEVKDSIYTKKQFPLRLAYAVSIHKSQGSTIDCLEIDIGSKIFCHGQAYTAISRAKNLEGLRVINFDPLKMICDKRVVEFYKLA